MASTRLPISVENEYEQTYCVSSNSNSWSLSPAHDSIRVVPALQRQHGNYEERSSGELIFVFNARTL